MLSARHQRKRRLALAFAVGCAIVAILLPFLAFARDKDKPPSEFGRALSDRIEAAFVAEFTGAEADAARQAWQHDARFALERVGDDIYPQPDPAAFTPDAIEALRAKRKADPAAPLKDLVAAALNPHNTGVKTWTMAENFRMGAEQAKTTATLQTVKGVAVLRIPMIATETLRQIDEIPKPFPARVIVDLRGNEGGPLDAIVPLAENFLPPETLVLTIEEKDHTTTHLTRLSPDARPSNLLVLIDPKTNSGALALAAALVDQGHALVAGRLAESPAGTIFLARVIVKKIGDEKPEQIGIKFPTGILRRPSGALISAGLAVDIPIATEGDAALDEAIKAFDRRSK